MKQMRRKLRYKTELEVVKKIAASVWKRHGTKNINANLAISPEELRALYDFIDEYCIYGANGVGSLKREFNKR